MRHQALDLNEAALLIIDMQEKLYPHVDHPCDLLEQGLKLIKGCQLLNLPVTISEQYPEGLKSTIEAILNSVNSQAIIHKKTSFSCFNDPVLKNTILTSKRKQWILMGIEAHVCVLQTARDLLNAGFEVIVANDAISSRSIFDYSTAIAELRDLGVRITSVETILFDLMKDAKHPVFKSISELIK